MDQLIEVKNIKNEPIESITSDRMEIPNEIHVESIKQESDCLVQTEINIKTKPQQDDSEFLVIVGTSYETCPNYDIKFEKEEPLIKIEYEDPVDEIMQDPLDVRDELKVEVSTSKSGSETSYKSGQIKEEIAEEDFLLTSNEEGSHERSSLNNRDELSIQNKKNKNIKFICPVCSKTFSYKSQLDMHLLIHSGSRPFTCDICNKSFRRKGALYTHMLTHSVERPHICDLCKKAFKHKSTLNEHKLIHSDIENPFICRVCKKSFAQKKILISHKRIHTGDKPFTCDLCSKSFTKKQHLIFHKQLHSDDKPFSCDFCQKAFPLKSYLTLHRRTHTGERPYCCDLCDKSYTNKSTLNKHKKSHKN